MADPIPGEVWLVDLEPTEGSEADKRRPCVVLQDHGLCKLLKTRVVVPLTTNLGHLGHAGTAHMRKGEGGINLDSVALGYHVRAVALERFAERLGQLPNGPLELVGRATMDALGLVGVG